MGSTVDVTESSTKPTNPLSSETLPLAERRIYQGILQPRNFPGLPENWLSEWETFTSHDEQVQLYGVLHRVKELSPGTPVKALVVLHGLGEHGGRYLHLPHYLQSMINAVYCIDHRGHGRSGGIRAYVDQFDQYCDDALHSIRRLHQKLLKDFGSAEIHLLGHSMGGLIALRALFRDSAVPIRSATITAPLLGVGVEVPWVKRAAAGVLSRVWGSLHMKTEIDPATLSHDQEVALAYQLDRLVHHKATPKFYVEMISAIEDTLKRDSGIEIPLLMVVPMQDQIVNPEASLQFFRALKLRDKLLKTYPDFYHEPLNELEKQKVFDEIVAWIRSHSE